MFRPVLIIRSANYFLNFNVPIERARFGSEYDRIGQYANCYARNYFARGELRFIGHGYNDPDNGDSLAARIRGDSIRTNTGALLSVEYAHPLFKIRKGLWNPNIYLEDLCGTVFVDYAVSKERESVYSFGAEVKLEIGTALGFVKVAPTIGVAFNRNLHHSFYVSITSLPFLK